MDVKYEENEHALQTAFNILLTVEEKQERLQQTFIWRGQITLDLVYLKIDNLFDWTNKITRIRPYTLVKPLCKVRVRADVLHVEWWILGTSEMLNLAVSDLLMFLNVLFGQCDLYNFLVLKYTLFRCHYLKFKNLYIWNLICTNISFTQ